MAGIAHLQQLIEPAVRAVGLELWGVEYQARGRQALLRIYIDGPNGVTVENCAQASRQVSSVLDVEDPISGEYTLEVSSPGADRPLYTLAHYRQFIGARVKLRLRLPYEGRRGFTGLLQGVENDEVVLAVGDEEYVLPFESVERANIVSNTGKAG